MYSVYAQFFLRMVKYKINMITLYSFNGTHINRRHYYILYVNTEPKELE